MHFKTMVLASTLALSACSDMDNAQLPNSSSIAPDSTAACSALNQRAVDATAIALPTRGAIVDAARLVAASPTNANGEFCLITGRIVSVDTSAQPIGFSLALPTAWNQRAVQLGGGGWDGAAADPTAPADPSEAPPAPLANGYAVFGDDGGHLGAGASFAMNDEQLPLFPALERWVESDLQPGMLTATDMNPAAAGRTRPLCRYPTWPKYMGTGDPGNAASFVCAND